MKNQIIVRSIFLVFVGLLLGNSTFAQTAKKNTTRLSIQYVKNMDAEVLVKIKATSRVDKKNVTVGGIELSVFNEIGEESILLGTTTTKMNGECNFLLSDFNAIKADSLHFYNLKVNFKGNDKFKKASKSLSFKNAEIRANIITKDSTNYITASLIDLATNTPIANESLGVQVQRLFQPLQIEEFNITDENGTIIVSIEEGIPGIDGNLNLEVILSEHEEYGTIKAVVIAPIGSVIVEDSTFDERTMWSPRNKTPIFLLIFPNLLIFGMWGLIIYLIINLFKITKKEN